jgi:hypothetical protein
MTELSGIEENSRSWCLLKLYFIVQDDPIIINREVNYTLKRLIAGSREQICVAKSLDGRYAKLWYSPKSSDMSWFFLQDSPLYYADLTDFHQKLQQKSIFEEKVIGQKSNRPIVGISQGMSVTHSGWK